MARKEHARKVAAMREWSDEELRLLDKAVAKYPQGTPKRWEQVGGVWGGGGSWKLEVWAWQRKEGEKWTYGCQSNA